MVTIVGVRMFDKDIASALSIIKTECLKSEKLNLCISATGAHGLVTARKDSRFHEVLSSFFLNLPDGMPSVWVGMIKGAKNMQRCYGPDFFRDCIVETKNEQFNHYFCGGKAGVAEDLKAVCNNKFGNNKVVGVYSPPFREMTDGELECLAEEINSLGTNIVWIGLSTPKQEVFASRLKKYTNVNFICTVGAAFDFHTGNVKQAPKILQNMGLEWLFRLVVEPKRLWRRYIEIVPKFIYYNLLELIK